VGGGVIILLYALMSYGITKFSAASRIRQIPVRTVLKRQ
jgi:hypothetical protein